MRRNLIVTRWFGVPAGQNVALTVVYLSRASAWEAQLPVAVRDQVRHPRRNPERSQSWPFDSSGFGSFTVLFPRIRRAGGWMTMPDEVL